ncbi:hypothetical protein NVP1238A_04 [Vibrio phage 1.238.A._10N.261.52.F10]|uniref:Uncharacterized protein n=1 Tax=Vibrio phage 1.238.A._10N.261.52.F10 TaxID=1881231 RepID=A0A2I7RUD7_9CAUD|nr:hypothetical protein KNT79_gp04 [Vibrio phage 1.238.A._10N.261.52.F10]AUR97253.1 hypothetical protein NVP1238A_04 [Vibrio phage 1.238.A._10N.261.52.F10]AUR97347.1 hypothetical protein NVP1238B_05 [Vibrio phage 1.238.B._10N.261.52.F10]
MSRLDKFFAIKKVDKNIGVADKIALARQLYCSFGIDHGENLTRPFFCTVFAKARGVTAFVEFLKQRPWEQL